MTQIVLDIESIPSQLPWVRDDLRAAVKAPAQYKKPESIAQWLEENRESEAEEAWLKTSFDGALGQIVCIAWAVDDGEAQSMKVEDLTPAAERKMLVGFFAALRSLHSTSGTRPVLIGHNHVAFDIPFLWKRAIILGVKPPLWFPRNPKPWAESVADTMTLWDSNSRISMDRLCKVLGIHGKDGMTGANVWPAVRDGRIDEVESYCRSDVLRSRAIYRRMTFGDAA